MSANALRELGITGEAERDALFGQAPHEVGADGDSATETDDSSAASQGTPRSAVTPHDAAQQETLTNFQRTLERFASGIVPSQELGGDTLASAGERHRCVSSCVTAFAAQTAGHRPHYADTVACCLLRLASNVGLDLPAVATWCEKALPFLLLLLCTFIYRHIQGEMRKHARVYPSEVI